MQPPFAIGEAIRFGWQKTRAHSGLVFQVLFTLLALQIVHSLVARVLLPSFEGVIAVIIITIINIVLGAGAMLITLKLARGEDVSYSSIVPPLDLVGRFFCAYILAGIVTILGFILLIIPGIYLLLRYSMVRFAALDGKGIVDSLRESARLTQGVKWRLLGFLCVLALLNLLGFLVFFVGLLVTIPTSMLAYAHVYEKLRARVETPSSK